MRDERTTNEIRSIIEAEEERKAAAAEAKTKVEAPSGATYTVAELRGAFDAVTDPDDWKAEVDALVPVSNLDVTRTAIRFFTATEPKVDFLDLDTAHVRAAGYRDGPAGG